LSERWEVKGAAEIKPIDLRQLLAEVHRDGVPGLDNRKGKACDSRKRAMGATLSKLFSWLLEQGLAGC
jgi:hypothetical protein